jgi:hypothetical protein
MKKRSQLNEHICTDVKLLKVLGPSCLEFHNHIIQKGMVSRSSAHDVYSKVSKLKQMFNGSFLADGKQHTPDSIAKLLVSYFEWIYPFEKIDDMSDAVVIMNRADSVTLLTSTVFATLSSSQLEFLHLVLGLACFEVFLKLKTLFRLRFGGFRNEITLFDAKFFLSSTGVPIEAEDEKK